MPVGDTIYTADQLRDVVRIHGAAPGTITRYYWHLRGATAGGEFMACTQCEIMPGSQPGEVEMTSYCAAQVPVVTLLVLLIAVGWVILIIEVARIRGRN